MSNNNINNSKIPINRGVELVLRGGKKKKSNILHFITNKILNFRKREINFYFEISLNMKKKEK